MTKSIKYTYLLISVFLLVLSGCNKDDGPKIRAENEVNTFIWNGLNSWYFWQSHIEDLSDDKFKSENKKNEFLNQFTDSKKLFEALRHESDRFSWIVDDYEALGNSLQGISESFGYEFGLVRHGDSAIVGYVQYVLDDSPAAIAGIKRGDIFYKVNDQIITDHNYVDLLFRTSSYRLSLATLISGVLTPSVETPMMVAVQITENPVLLAEVIDFEGFKVGYLVYNAFTHTFHSELNSAFQKFKEANVTDLVVDLRYNSGGSIYTSMELASLIHGASNADMVFGKFLYNEKHAENSVNLPFLNEMSILNGEFAVIGTEELQELFIDKVYFLTSSGTASASELLIVGLQPYMEVKVIGDQTIGKNEGSITLYDSPSSDFRDKNIANPTHKWAMQPIILKLANSVDFTEYSDGLIPDIKLREVDFIEGMKQLGDPEEIILKTALEDIAGIGSIGRKVSGRNEIIFNSKAAKRFGDHAHINGMEKFQ